MLNSPDPDCHGLFARLLSGMSLQVSRLVCGIQGHFILLNLEPHKMSLRCGLCGYESEGWEVGPRKPVLQHRERRRVPRLVKDGRPAALAS